LSKQHIEITQVFNAPVKEIFSLLTDHESFGEIINTNIKRIVDSHDENKNGIGSVRRATIFPLPGFEESVITFEQDQLMEYTVSKGSPVKNHKGRIEFFNEQGTSRVHYVIDFEPRLPFCFLGAVLKSGTEKPIKEGLAKLAEKYAAKE
jgi:uncharacterized protein YndB with AHSA1/START domain